MDAMTDIISELRDVEDDTYEGTGSPTLCGEAADEIEHLATEVSAAWVRLEMFGVTKERGKDLPGALDVLDSRLSKESRINDCVAADNEKLSAEVSELKEEVYRRDCDIEGLNSDIAKHFDAGFEAAVDFSADAGENIDDARAIYLSSIDRDSGNPNPCDHKGHLAKDDNGDEYCTWCDWPNPVDSREEPVIDTGKRHTTVVEKGR